MRKVYVVRGLPGSGKSTLSKRLAGKTGRVHSTDDFFVSGGEYEFSPQLLQRNHDLNFESFCRSLSEGVPVVVLDNTNSRRWEYERYVVAAKQNGYEVKIISMPHMSAEVSAKQTIHNVPVDVINQMIARWENDPRENTSITPQEQGDPP